MWMILYPWDSQMALEVMLQPSKTLFSKIVKLPFLRFSKVNLEGWKISFGYG